MAYANSKLTITLKKQGKRQARVYDAVPMRVAYGLYMAGTATEVLSYYAKNIRKKFNVIQVR